MPQEVVNQYSFGTFAFSLTLLIVILIFCIMFFYVRRKRTERHIDKKAGDEGED